MSYCTLADIRDELLKRLVTDDDFKEADSEIDDIARSLNIDPAQIPNNPYPSIVTKLAAALTLSITARNNSLMNGADGEDPYEKKRQVWAKEADRLTKMITPELLLGGKPPQKSKFPFSIAMKRS